MRNSRCRGQVAPDPCFSVTDSMFRSQEFEFAADSPLEGTGFEPSVPRKAPGVVVVSVLVRADFSVSLESSRGEMSELEEEIERRAFVRFTASKALIMWGGQPLLSPRDLIALWHVNSDAVHERYREEARDERGAQ